MREGAPAFGLDFVCREAGSLATDRRAQPDFDCAGDMRPEPIEADCRVAGAAARAPACPVPAMGPEREERVDLLQHAHSRRNFRDGLARVLARVLGLAF